MLATRMRQCPKGIHADQIMSARLDTSAMSRSAAGRAIIASALHAIDNGALHALKKHQPTDQDKSHHPRRYKYHRARSVPAPGNAPAKPVDHVSHGIQMIERAPTRRHQRAG